jgi:hypothetical protein
MKLRLLSSLVALCCVLGVTNDASARRRYYVYYYDYPPPWVRAPVVTGYIGGAGFGTIVARQDGGVEYLHSGGGLSVFGGITLIGIVGFEAKYSVSFHNPIDSCTATIHYVWCDANHMLVETFGLDLKLHIPTRTRFVPYFTVGPLVSWIGRQGSVADAVGGGFEAGGGFDIWFTRHGTIGFEALYRGLLMQDYATFTGTNTYLSLVQLGGTLAAHF